MTGGTMRQAINETYYRDLGRCVPMTRVHERGRGAELARRRDRRDELVAALAHKDDDELTATERRVLQAAERAYAVVRNEFVRANLRLVVKIAGQFANRRMPLADLIQEGNIGLMTAVDRFDPTREVRFCTYAAWWVRHRVGRATVNHGRAVRVPNHIAQCASKLGRTGRELERRLGRTPTVQELAAATDVPVKKIRLALQATGRVLSLDASASADDDRSLMSTLADDSSSATDDLDDQQRHETVARVLANLDPLEADILRKRFAFDVEEPLTLREIGTIHSLSRERIRQIQNKALAKVRRELAEFAA
jgi:RNA polymerase sigma factor (sigma-70 family)